MAHAFGRTVKFRPEFKDATTPVCEVNHSVRKDAAHNQYADGWHYAIFCTLAKEALMRAPALSVVALTFFMTLTTAALADPPMGTWVGDHGSLAFTLSGNGTYVIPSVSVGTWNWQQTGPTGGILTFFYDTPTATQTFHNKLYFSIEFIDANSAILTDPASGLRDTIRRR
jgi:hypothetical protein